MVAILTLIATVRAPLIGIAIRDAVALEFRAQRKSSFGVEIIRGS